GIPPAVQSGVWGLEVAGGEWVVRREMGIAGEPGTPGAALSGRPAPPRAGVTRGREVAPYLRASRLGRASAPAGVGLQPGRGHADGADHRRRLRPAPQPLLLTPPRLARSPPGIPS